MNNANVAGTAGAGSLSRPLVLICGLPRSGTSWIGKIFDSHPDVIYRHEPDTLTPIRGVPLLASKDDVEQYRAAVVAFCTELPRIRRTKVSATVPVFMKSYQPSFGWFVRRLSVGASRYLGRIFGEMPVPEGVNYDRFPHAPVVWKSIQSTGRLGVLATAMPRSRCILVLRHPCGHVASVLRGEARRKFSSSLAISDDYGIFELLAETPQARRHGLDLEAFRQMTPVERLAWRWALFNEKALDETEGLTNTMVFRYEDLCAQPLEMAQQLFAFSGLNWNRQTEEFLSTSTSQDRGSYYSIFRDPLKSANKWKDELEQESIDQTMDVAKQTRAGAYYFSR